VKVALVAEEAAGIQVLRALAGTSSELVAVLTAPPRTGGGATVASAAAQLGVETLSSERVKTAELAEWMREREVDLMLNVHSLYIVHGDVVAAPRIGSFNLHPGPLPRYAGLNAPSWAIYEGETEHAVTVHWMEPGVDTGAIAYEERFPIEPTDTGLSVSAKAVRHGLPLVMRLLEAAAADPSSIPAKPQDLAERRVYLARDVPNGGRLAWSKPARRIVDFVRAADYSPFASPWGHPVTRVGETELAVVRATATGEPAGAPPGTVEAGPGEEIRIAAADEWVAVHRIQVEGRYVAAGELLRPGQRLEEPEHAGARG
jgi:methionyl-tRNA formyltransferase